MKKRIALVVGIVLIAILAYISSSFLGQYLFVPIMNILHIIWVFIGALPQALWWGILLLLLLVIVFRSMQWGYERRVEQRKEKSYPLSRAKIWSNLIGGAQKGEYSNWLLTNQLSDLTLELLAHRERMSKEQVQHNLVSGTLELPSNINSFLLAGTQAPSFRHYSDLLTRSKRAGKTNQYQTDLLEIVEFLESLFQQ